MNQLLNGKPYSGVTTFGQLLSSKCYLTSEVLSPLVQDRVSGELISSGIPTGFLFVAADATSVLDFLENTFQLFFITAVAVLLISLVICSITVQRMVDPLKGMCAFAHKFAHGEVDTRITEYTNRKDEIGELAIAFNAMADSLAQAEQKRSEFVANVSHELKTPMTSIIGYSDTLLHVKISEEQQKKALEHINSECRRLERLSGKMMTLIGLYDEDRIHKEPYPVDRLVREVADLERYHMQDSQMELLASSESWECEMDVDLMESLLVNLLDNAIKASKPGSVIELHGEKGCIWVRDSGKGIPEEEIPRITEAFYMVDKSRSRKAGGIGMGLALCQKIAEIHRANLVIESVVGQGTKISVVFQEETDE